MIPFDPRKPAITSGVRIGTPAVTSRGFREPQMGQVADFVGRVLEDHENAELLSTVRDEVATLCREFPLYPERWNETD